MSKTEDLPNGPKISLCIVASIVATAASLMTMGLILGIVTLIDGSPSPLATIILPPLMALAFGWLIFPLATFVAFGLFAVVGYSLSSAGALPGRRNWMLSGAGVGLLVALAMSGEIWLRGAGSPDDWPPLLHVAARASGAALFGIVGLAIWKKLVVLWQS